eukprot:scaffold17527_cov42-Cyclotella_meneghiniana.AAC.6
MEKLSINGLIILIKESLLEYFQQAPDSPETHAALGLRLTSDGHTVNGLRDKRHPFYPSDCTFDMKSPSRHH